MLLVVVKSLKPQSHLFWSLIDGIMAGSLRRPWQVESNPCKSAGPRIGQHTQDL